MSGETAAIGLGFLLGGPVGAIVGGTVAPAALAALMWRSRRAEDDANSNGDGTNNSDRGSGAGGNGSQGRGNGRGNNGGGNGSGGGRHKTPNGSGHDGAHRKPKTKDPIADKLNRLGKDLGNKLKNRGKHDGDHKNPKHGKDDKHGKGPKGDDTTKDLNGKKNGGAKGLKDGLRDGLKVTDRGKQPDSDRPWRGRGHKDKPGKPKKDRKDRTGKTGAGTSAATARDGLEPKHPKGGSGSSFGDDIVDGEIVDDGLPPKPTRKPGDVIDGEVIDEDRIALVRAKRERDKRRAAITAGKKAAEEAARDQTMGDPRQVKLEVIRHHNQRIDLEIHHENQRLALTAAAETPRSTPVNYPAIAAAPAGTRTAGTAIARQVDFRTSTAFAILRAMADQLAHGLYNDGDADMADHIVELTGIPNMCKNLSIAVQEAARALARTAPLHPSVVKHLNNAAVAARSAGVMADTIMVVFVQAHREDIIRVLDPRIGEERWNLRNGPGTLDAAKLRAAIASAHSARLALPAGTAPAGGGGGGGSKLVPASDGSTKKLITLMKGFTRGHMVNVLSEVAGAAAGVEVVADSVTKLYRRMVNTWPTEGVVDDTVRATASKVRSVSDELKKAIKAAQRAHARELKLNARPRKGPRSESKWDVAGRRSSSN
ncbi:hypothetical protein ACWC09_26320 [Streptomyces sp. NPDC001617]